MRVTFWGTRGSIPAPGPGTVEVGGNTTCLEVVSDDGTRIVVDAGTGIRVLGLELVKDPEPQPIILLLTHSHWDHLAGFTFFAPAYHPLHRISVYGNLTAMNVLQRDIFQRLDNRYFPVNMDDFRAEIVFNPGMPSPFVVGGIRIDTLNLNHPGNGFAYRFSIGSRKVAFITDNEIGKRYPGGNTRDDIERFCRGVDILIHDAQYLPAEISYHRGWGHSTYEEVVDLAGASGVGEVYLTHHDPERDDDACRRLLDNARRYAADKKFDLACNLAMEGHTIDVV